MGLFDKFKKDEPTGPPAKLMSDETAQHLKEQQDMLNAAIAANPGAMPDMSGDPADIQAQMAAAMADRERIENSQKHGVDSPAVIQAIRPTGKTDLSGGWIIEFDISIRPAVGESYETTITQHMLPAQLERLSLGASVTVKYVPGAPETALIIDW